MEIIEPAGFDVSDRHLRRSGLDTSTGSPSPPPLVGRVLGWRRAENIRLVLATTQGALPYTAFAYRDGDCLLMGRESAGVPEAVHAAAEARVVVPIRPDLRSLNVAVCAAMILGEALRQTEGFPGAD